MLFSELFLPQEKDFVCFSLGKEVRRKKGERWSVLVVNPANAF